MKNIKRLLLIALMTVVTVSAFTQQYAPESDFEVTKLSDGKSIEITKYVGTAGQRGQTTRTVNIPPSIQGLSVTSIGNGAFQRRLFTSVIIPDSVTSIGKGAFEGCIRLASITLPVNASFVTIEEATFYDCTELTSITIPNSVTEIKGGYDVYGRIGRGAFTKCTSLASITIPNSITSIGEYAFSDCTSLTSVTIPNSVKSIGNGAFDGCTRLGIVIFQGVIVADKLGSNNNRGSFMSPFLGDLRDKYLAGGIGTYFTYLFVNNSSVWTKQ